MASKSMPFVRWLVAEDTVTMRAFSWEGDVSVAANRAGNSSCVNNQ
jgi:hypothetical protein